MTNMLEISRIKEGNQPLDALIVNSHETLGVFDLRIREILR